MCSFKKIRYLLLLICFIFCFNGLFSQNSEKGPVLSLSGNLSQEKLDKLVTQLDQIKNTKPAQIVIDVNSSSGDLSSVLDFSRKLYQIREETGSKIIVYIDNAAVGPAAIIPFVADELLATSLVTWGDIPLGSPIAMPVNILRSQVKGLISRSSSNVQLLDLLAEGMVDPSIEIIDDQGWKIAAPNELSGKKVISYGGETLVIDQNQLKELKLVTSFISPEKFKELYGVALQPLKQTLPPPEPDLLGVPQSKLNAQLKEHIKFSSTGPNQIGYIGVNGKKGIDQSTWVYIKTALDEYKKTKPSFIILELDTPGGEVFSAEQISDAFKEMDTSYGIPIVAYIDNWAMSAGAMLAYSCRFIAISKDASMGAAEPVIATETGEMKSTSEKVRSAFRTDFANRALFYDRNPLLAEAMVDADVILVLRHGVITKLDNESEIITTGLHPDKVINAKGKLLTLTAPQLMEYGVADILLLPTQLPLITDEEKLEGKWPASKMELFQYPFFQSIPNAIIMAHQIDWKVRFFAWLANPVVSSLLLLGLMIGFYMEMNHPGFGVPGMIAVTCLILILLSSFSLQAINWLEVIILVIGVILILLELFVLPGFGIPGVIGILMAVSGLILMMLPKLNFEEFTLDPEKMTIAAWAFLERLGWLCATILIGFICIYFLAKYVMPKFSRFSRLVLTGEQDSSRGYVAGFEVSELPAVGSKGEALSPLRPSGKVFIEDTLYDAISEGGFIEKGARITILRYEGSRMIVGAKED